MWTVLPKMHITTSPANEILNINGFKHCYKVNTVAQAYMVSKYICDKVTSNIPLL